MEFIGRKYEVDQLLSWDKKESKLTVVYGRRRVGKTRLIEEAFKKKNIYKFEGVEGQSEHEGQREFLNQYAINFSMPEMQLFKVDSWSAIFLLLSKKLDKTPCVLFFDEFQWMGGESKKIVSHLKYAWDNYFLKNNRVHIILCGSVSSFMVKQVIRSKALYGRIDLEINLKPLHLQTIVPFLKKKRSLSELIEMYMVTGGVPQYIKMFDLKKSILLNLQDLCFSPNGYLVNEFDRIFISHFGRNVHYRNIIESLIHFKIMDQNQIAHKCKIERGGRLSEYMDNLEIAGLIEKYPNVGQNNTKRNCRYRIADFYLHFYLTFIYPQLKRIQSSGVKNSSIVNFLPQTKYSSWQGLAFERICLKHKDHIAQKLGFGAIRYDAGSWYSLKNDTKNAQIDLAYIRADKVISLCEIKYTNTPVGKDVIVDFQKKENVFPNKKRYTIERVLISACGITESLKNEAYFHKVLTAEELFE